ncbi:PQQ-binding-like beta-propeller repeat protein [Ferruginibacter lapsinanis]|uniref:outer membrane protein assembly factor BamB family protein n=1 Tax=Ferruginibacter lapsinanis TaxID=563172 RepID=UPI001E352F66|nr:PQQ-binding-like beta-propeller repeat protein [Ferruginibacter lapsinanis]UEG51281.1 PQQ-binding-like beta-propeller repeat protein [Ferruginibacter lapsinanis]
MYTRYALLLIFINSIFFTPLYSQPKTEKGIADFTSKPVLNWTFATGKPIYSSPQVSDGIVFFGSCDSNMYALNTAKGTIKWKLKTGGEIRSTACISGDDVYFLSGDGLCYCVNRHSGSVKWKFATAGEKQYELYSFADYVQSSPVYNDGLLYFGSGDGSIYALNANNGSLVWKYATGAVVHATPALDSNFLYVGSFDGFFYAVNKKTGDLAWKFKSVGYKYFPKGEMQGTPLVVNDVIVVGSRDYNLYGINKTGGYCEWNRKFPKGWAMGSPAFNNSVVFVGTSDDYEMHAIDPATGLSKWKTNVKFNIFGSTSFTRSMLYFGTLMGKLFALDEKTGNIEWSFSTPGYKKNRSTFFTDRDELKENIFGTVIKKNEDFLSMYITLGGIFSTPAITDDQIIFTSLDGNMYALKRTK